MDTKRSTLFTLLGSDSRQFQREVPQKHVLLLKSVQEYRIKKIIKDTEMGDFWYVYSRIPIFFFFKSLHFGSELLRKCPVRTDPMPHDTTITGPVQLASHRSRRNLTTTAYRTNYPRKRKPGRRPRFCRRRFQRAKNVKSGLCNIFSTRAASTKSAKKQSV